MLQRHGGLGVGTDHNDFGRAQVLEGLLEPVDPRILRQPLLVAHPLLRTERRQAGGRAVIQCRARQRNRQRLALREPLYRCPGVTEQHPAGAVAVEQGIDNGLDGIRGRLQF